MKEQRNGSRYTVNQEFESISNLVFEYVTNISQSGIFIKTKEPLPVDTIVNLEFSVVVEDIETIKGIGKVVRVIETPEEEKGMGITFIELDPYSQQIIDRFIKKYPPA